MMESLGPDSRWTITGVIGAGGFSTVYSATDTRFESPVAIKVLADNMANNLDIRERFLSEALLLRRNPGPTVPVYDTGETSSGQPFIVMPVADGGDLATRIQEWREVAVPTDDDIVHLAETLSHVLAGLHEQGIVHRDLKPSNLLIFGARKATPHAETQVAGSLIDRGETVLLSDLGFAKDLVKSSGLTVGGGTPGYTPPEQRQAGRVDHRADIWGASAIIYWFMVGHPPADTKAQRRAMLEATASPALINAIEVGLSDNPAHRPKSMTTWYRSIEAAVRHGIPPAQTTSAWYQQPRSMLAVAAVAVVLAAGMSFAVARMTGPEGDPATVETSQDGNLTTATAELDGTIVSIIGPAVIEMGSTATFTSNIDPAVADWTWVSPAGTLHHRDVALPLEATSIGQGEVTLIATTATGQRLQAAIQIEVVP